MVVRTDPARIEDLWRYATPRTVGSLAKFLGLANYYAGNIPSSIYSPLETSLRSVLKKGDLISRKARTRNIQSDWNRLGVQAAFDGMKAAIIQYSTLVLHEPRQATYLRTDAAATVARCCSTTPSLAARCRSFTRTVPGNRHKACGRLCAWRQQRFIS